ncbi:MAG: BT_3928 family protein [Candidatus Limimorpha sp.]
MMVVFKHKSKLASFAFTGMALLCAVLVAFVPQFSCGVLALVLLTLLLSALFARKYNDKGIALNRMLVGALFIFSSFTKGVDPLGTKYKIVDYLSVYGMEWLNNAALVLAIVLILAEFIVGICLFLNLLPRLSSVGAAILMAYFTVVTFFDALLDLVPDCGCFGDAVKMSNWQTFNKNLIIDSLLLPILINFKSLKNKRLTLLGQWIFSLLFIAAFVYFEIFNIRHLPIIDFREWKVGKDMTPEEYEAGQIYLLYQNKETGETQEFVSPDYPWNDTAWMSQWEFVSQRSENASSSLAFSILDADGDDFTNVLFDTENLYVFVAPYLDDVSEKDLENCKKMAEKAENDGFNYIWITSSSPDAVEKLNEEYQMFYDVYFGDELELKTMVRSNPGLLLIDNGLILGKWSKIDFPIE